MSSRNWKRHERWEHFHGARVDVGVGVTWFIAVWWFGFETRSVNLPSCYVCTTHLNPATR